MNLFLRRYYFERKRLRGLEVVESYDVVVLSKKMISN